MSANGSHSMVSSGKGSDLFERYEELILRKSALQKECFQLEQEYLRIFGKDIMALYHMQLECARKKKTIEFCQIARNHGQEPDEKQLESFIAAETAELKEHFQQLREAYENSKVTGEVTEAEFLEIRQIYHRLVKLIHPDLHPELEDKLFDKWNQIVMAYKCNDLGNLRELEVLVAAALAEVSGKEISIDIPDIKEKIKKLEAEIVNIMSKTPYQYKFLLTNPNAVNEKKESLKSELKNYELYSKQLDRLLEDVLPEGMIIVWNGR